MSYQYVRGDVHVTGRRVVATVIDMFVLGLAGGFLSGMFGYRMGVTGADMSRLATRGNLLLLLVAGAYYTLMEGVLGRTVGKMVTGIRVIDANTGGVPGFGKALGRTLLRFLDSIGGYLVAFLVVVLTDRRRRLGDMAAGTLVIRG